MILALSGLGYVLWVALFSSLHYDKAQLNAYDTLRYELAEGDAPNGPTSPNNPDQLLAPGSPVAVMSIPAIGLRTVILQGTTSAVLENGPGHQRDTPMPGQAGISVILGRKTAYGGPFGKLASLVPGDKITVVTGQTVAGYTVVDLRRAGLAAARSARVRAGRMVLVTSVGAPLVPSGMLYVDADMTSKPQPAPDDGAVVQRPVAERARPRHRAAGVAADRALGAAAGDRGGRAGLALERLGPMADLADRGARRRLHRAVGGRRGDPLASQPDVSGSMPSAIPQPPKRKSRP